MFKRLGNSFKYAARGIRFCVSHEMNMRIHIVATMCVLYLSQFYNFTKEQFIFGITLFWDTEKFVLIFRFFTGDIWNLAMLAAFACLAFMFVAKGKKRNIKGKMNK